MTSKSLFLLLPSSFSPFVLFPVQFSPLCERHQVCRCCHVPVRNDVSSSSEHFCDAHVNESFSQGCIQLQQSQIHHQIESCQQQHTMCTIHLRIAQMLVNGAANQIGLMFAHVHKSIANRNTNLFFQKKKNEKRKRKKFFLFFLWRPFPPCRRCV